MKPLMIGSPVYSVYRQASSLKTHWRRIEAVATHSNAAVNCAVTLGPMSHSLLPIAPPRIIAPAPATLRALLNPYGGGAGRSAISQAGSRPASTLPPEPVPETEIEAGRLPAWEIADLTAPP